ncbi:SUN domain-containing ossification factor isoform X2 [Oryzias melastigma]|uniref:SUN domain-containing ossification factor-like n=1 Tax=Oryzias melastigma TaxID=30732 RepID=A0A3B3D9N7_ORYME|nr:SUN domain-containing ossification factor isoform X2 [Oryzias melastigma]
MKMTQLFRRSVSLWLYIAVVCWSSRLFECVESPPEEQRPGSTQISIPKEESHYQENEKSLSFPSSDTEQFTDGDHPETLPKAQEEELKAHAESSEAEKSAFEVELDASKVISNPESSSTYPETSVSEDQVLQPASTNLEFGSSAVNNDDSSSVGLQEDVPNSASSDASDAAIVEAGSEALHNDCEVEEENPFDTERPPLVLENTSNVHTTGTIIHADPPLSPPAAPADRHLDSNMSRKLTEPSGLSPPGPTSDTESSGSKEPEDIPTFDEWKRKMMEVEKEKTLSTETFNNGGSHVAKKVQKHFNNYASVECGAKLLGANPEAKSTSAILKENMDLYMLNPCSTKIWFIIELCEPIQVRQLDIANFELFSSTPKDFLVSISDRYPTNKWLKLGTFHARDERTVQSFPLDEHLYAKYVKVELVSHFGSEHFCPLSLIRVFGTSMVEEYEIADPSERADDQDDDLDNMGFSAGEPKSENLIGSAKDAIMNMVNNIANNVLGGSTEKKGNLSSQEEGKSESPEEPEVTSEGVTSDLPAVDDVQILPESDPPPAEQPSSETPQPEEKDANHTESEVPEEEKQLVILLEKEEEEPTITLLEKEDEKKRDAHEHHPVDPNCCSPAPSLWEFVLRRCSAKSRKCQTADGEPESPPAYTSVWPLAPPSEPEPPHIEDEGTSQLPETVEHSESELLDPSLTLNLPAFEVSESSCAKPTTAVETPPLSSKEPIREAERSQDVSVDDVQTAESSSSSVHVIPSISFSVDVSVTPTEPNAEATQTEMMAPIPTQDPSSVLPPTYSSQPEHQAEAPLVPEGLPGPTEGSGPASEPFMEAETSGSQDANTEDIPASSSGNGHLSHSASSAIPQGSASDIYAEPFNGTEQNGNPMHGSSQKESVFMRLNNRIKALEVNMSLSGRYLEQLSQRYRKQMEEMQRAFNKTIIKLQNTSRIAEEQDLRQTESIQLLHSQLENVTQLVLNLSVRVSQLHDEVSDRQTYLLLSLMLCLCLGLLLCVNHCRFAGSPSTDPEPPAPKSYTHCCPERSLSSCEEAGLKRSASYPLIHSDSLQLATSADPEVLHADETQSLCPANRKRRRRKSKLLDKVEALQVSAKSAPELCNGAACNGAPASKNPTVLTKQLLLPSFRDSPSEGSSEGSSHSDEPSFCGITAACSRVCDGLPQPKTRAEKRALRRRPPKPRCAVLGLPHDSQRDRREAMPVTIQDLLRRKPEPRSGAVATLTGSV